MSLHLHIFFLLPRRYAATLVGSRLVDLRHVACIVLRSRKQTRSPSHPTRRPVHTEDSVGWLPVTTAVPDLCHYWTGIKGLPDLLAAGGFVPLCQSCFGICTFM
ncbi:hypothetical protein CISG_04823 [Coccidioides immitis RMSCC 3703]|uniref:Secreted protein n=1 Tax=Coccidioides immitis RMSCC 3703 TaxID=454286 RepID=A0A0J8QSC7_COCIT|nr:hypothetical protein CISG_04823 [Coccidioides immitis RMSCC 3703]